METNKCTCPHCQQDISELVQTLVNLRIKQINAEKARRNISQEQKAKNRSVRIQRMQDWRNANPEKVKEYARKASQARTAESFARQKETVKETLLKKNIKFAELLFEAKMSGQELTEALKNQLLQKATQLVKEENKQAKRQPKKAAIQQAE